MTYPVSKVELLQYALNGAVNERGLNSGFHSEEDMEALGKDIAELERRLEAAKLAEQVRGGS